MLYCMSAYSGHCYVMNTSTFIHSNKPSSIKEGGAIHVNIDLADKRAKEQWQKTVMKVCSSR